jgi:predicted CXXCH cytochrome family protein
LDTAEEAERMNRPGCAHCHTAQGYWREILAGKKSKAPYDNAVGITCEACHDPERMSPEDPALRAGRPENACTGCHDILVQNDDKGFSSCLQGAMLRGEGGSEFAGTAYRTATHSQVEKNCVGCHMADSPPGEKQLHLGGHVFRVITKGQEPRSLNDAGCMECHVKISLPGIDKSQAEVRELMQELKSRLPKQKDGEPKFPEDPSLNKVQAKAAFNYYYILKDGTWGVHNPIYIRQLLHSSLEALGTGHGN